jgi:DNA-binding response OmpR family regulator
LSPLIGRIPFSPCEQTVIGGFAISIETPFVGTVRDEMTMTSEAPSAGQERRNGSANQATVRLAVIDSDSGFLQVLGKRLEGMGWQHRVLASPVPLDAMVALRLNAVVVDLAVLGPQGWTYLDKLCARLPGLGVIVCTGQSSVAQRVRGLRLGADDWVTKPCHPEELIARIEAVVRRRKRADVRVEKGPVVIGEVEVRADQFQAFVGGVSVELTRREYELIQLLAEAEGQVLQREEIYQRVWGYAMVHGDRSVDVFVRKLRSKLERVSPSWRYIHTHFGIGYRFAAEPVDEPVGASLPVPEPADASLSAPAAADAVAAPLAAGADAGEPRLVPDYVH